jgi:hypothetical protein
MRAASSEFLPIPCDGRHAPDKPAKWNVNAPPGMTTRQIPIDVDNGTWMNVDVSPDGRTIAFDLLGDIYTMPIAGGTPTRIAEGLAYEQQPRFSPDGRRIAFTSDRGGGDNIWIMNADGSDKRQLTKEDFRLLNQPSWSPDGRFIAAKKHFTTGARSAPARSGSTTSRAAAACRWSRSPTSSTRRSWASRSTRPTARRLFHPQRHARADLPICPGFEHRPVRHRALRPRHRRGHDGGFRRRRLGPADAVAGRQEDRLRPPRAGPLQALRQGPRLGRGAQGLRRARPGRAGDLGGDRRLSQHGLDPGQQPIVFWAGGKIRRVDGDGGGAARDPVPGQRHPGRDRRPHPQVEVAPDRFQTRMPRWASVSPDGRQVVFETLGKLWIKPMAGGAARRLVKGDEASSSSSRPGRATAGRSSSSAGPTRASANPHRRGGRRRGARRDRAARPLCRPRFSPDGKTIVFERGQGGGLTSPRWSENPGIYRVAAPAARRRGSPATAPSPSSARRTTACS